METPHPHQPANEAQKSASGISPGIDDHSIYCAICGDLIEKHYKAVGGSLCHPACYREFNHY